MKTCTRCKLSLNEDEFHRNKTAVSGLNYACRACCSAMQKERYHDGKLIQVEDEVDYMRILVYLRALRLPPTELTKIGIIDAWNIATDLHLPRMSDRGKDLKTTEITA